MANGLWPEATADWRTTALRDSLLWSEEPAMVPAVAAAVTPTAAGPEGVKQAVDPKTIKSTIDPAFTVKSPAGTKLKQFWKAAAVAPSVPALAEVGAAPPASVKARAPAVNERENELAVTMFSFASSAVGRVPAKVPGISEPVLRVVEVEMATGDPEVLGVMLTVFAFVVNATLAAPAFPVSK